MKKVISILICICLFISVSACKKDANTNSTTGGTASDTSNQAPSADSPSPTELISVSLPVVTDSVNAEDGSEVFRHVYQNMKLTLPDPEIAEKVILHYLNHSDKAVAAEEILTNAKKDYSGQSNWSPYLCQITYAPMRIDDGILSLLGTYSTYSGTAHPESSFMAVSYDLMTGSPLGIQDVLSATASAEVIYGCVLDSLEEQAEDKHLFAEYETIVRNRISNNLYLDTDWYFSEEGLCFFFSPYEIAPYASGVITGTIPYSQLTGVLKDAYMPIEREDVQGDVSVSRFDASIDNSLTQFTELKLSDGQDSLLISTQTKIQCVRIEIGYASADGTAFVPYYTVLGASALDNHTGVIVQTDLASCDLRISFLSNGIQSFKIITGDTLS